MEVVTWQKLWGRSLKNATQEARGAVVEQVKAMLTKRKGSMWIEMPLTIEKSLGNQKVL